jgi:hypothetical protein
VRVPSSGVPPLEPAFADALLPHQLRHAHAVEMAREGVPLIVIQRQLGHSNLGITSVYLQGIHIAEIIETVQPAGTDDPSHRVDARLTRRPTSEPRVSHNAAARDDRWQYAMQCSVYALGGSPCTAS